MMRKYFGIKMKKKEEPGKIDNTQEEQTFPDNPQLQAQLDSLDNEDRLKRNALFKRRMMLQKEENK